MIFKYVITLAQPDFPFPLLDIAILILKKLLPSAFPCIGSIGRLSISSAKSFFREGYFLANRLACLSKSGMDEIL